MALQNATKNDLDVTTTFKITPDRRNLYDNVQAYIFNSPGVPVNASYLGSDGDGNLLYESNTIGYSDFVVTGSGGNLEGGLLRTGGFKNINNKMFLISISFIVIGFSILFDLYNKNTKTI